MAKTSIFLVLFILQIASCKENNQIYDREFWIENDLIAGNDFNLYYNTKHTDSKLHASSSLIIKAHFLTKKGVKFYMLKMQRYEQIDGVFKTDFQVPSDAYFVDFDICDETDMKLCSYWGIKIISKEGKDLENSNLSLMIMQKNIEDKIKLFLIEDSLYPQNYDRFSRFGLELIQIGDTIRIREKLNLLKTYNFKPYSIEMINIYSNIATMYFFLREYDSTQNYLHLIKDKFKEVKDFNQLNFSYTLNQLVNVGNKPGRIVKLDPTKDSIVKTIFSIANVSLNKSLMLNFSRYMYLDSTLFKNNDVTIYDYLKNLKNLILESSSIDPSFVNILSSSFNSLIQMNNIYKIYDNTVDIKRNGDEYFQKYNYKFANDTNDFTFVGSDQSRLYDNFLYYIAINYDLQGKTSASHKILFELTKKSKEIAFLSSKYLFNNYFKVRNIDSVKKYLTLMYSLFEKATEQEFYKFNKINLELGMDTVKFENYFAKEPFKSSVPINNTTLISSNRIFNTKILKDSLLIVFYISDDCPSCNISLSPLLMQLEKHKKLNPMNLIVASNLDLKYLKSHYGNEVDFIKRPQFIFDVLQIKPYEYGAILIKNSQIIDHFEQIYSDENMYLKYLN